LKTHLAIFDKGHLVLALGFATILLLMVLLTSHAMDRVERLNLQLQRVVKEYNHKTALLKTMHRAARERIFTLHHMLLIDDPFEQDENALVIDEYGTQFTLAREQLMSLELSRYEEQLLAHQGELARYAVPLQREAVSAIITGDTAEARQLLLDEVIPTQHKVLATLSQLEAVQAKAIEDTVTEAQEQQVAARGSFLFMGGAALLLGLLIFLFSLFLARRLSYQAHHDPLTGISNRRGFERHLSKALQRLDAKQEGYLCLMDLDHFKQVNDSGGHAAGDALLKELVNMIGGIIRRDDKFARLGGDEFALLLERCPLKNARRIAMKIRDTVSENRFAWQGHYFQVGISIGIVAMGHGEQSANELMAMADDACYSAKEGGRKQIHLYREGEQGIQIIELAEATL
jgi:diguanylate cyclase (GGDEF)-like protein